MELPNIAAYAYQDVHVWSALLTCLRPHALYLFLSLSLHPHHCLIPRGFLEYCELSTPPPPVSNEHCVQRTLPVRTVFFWNLINSVLN